MQYYPVLLQDAPLVSPVIMAIIAILLIILFIWLLLRERITPPTEARVNRLKTQSMPEETKVEDIPAEKFAAKTASFSDAPVAEAPSVPAAAPSVPEIPAEPAVPPVPPVEPAPAVQAAADAPEAVPTPEAAPLKAAAPWAMDDLEIIEGIGPKIASVLKEAGVTTFAQLAEMDPARIEEIMRAANLRLADPQSWPEQARLAAAGDQAGLQALQDRLKGGRMV